LVQREFLLLFLLFADRMDSQHLGTTFMPQPHSKSVLVLAPHPDDETFGCGGTIRMLSDSGVDVDVAFMTRGEQGMERSADQTAEASRQLAETRSREARAACDVLGVRNVVFLNGHDTRLGDEPQHAAAIAELVQKGGYHRVFCPWPHDAHDDHKATFAHLRRAVAEHHLTASYWLYEVWKPLPANTYVPIDHTMEAKRRAIDQYQSQLSQLNYREGFIGLAAYRSLFCPASTYAEAFLVCDTREIHNIAESTP
jgi:N-acetylglucosamine malate deacetylase 1